MVEDKRFVYVVRNLVEGDLLTAGKNDEKKGLKIRVSREHGIRGMRNEIRRRSTEGRNQKTEDIGQWGGLQVILFYDALDL